MLIIKGNGYELIHPISNDNQWIDLDHPRPHFGYIWSAYEDKSGHVWYTDDGGGINVLSGTDNHLIPYPPGTSQPKTIYHFFEGPDELGFAGLRIEGDQMLGADAVLDGAVNASFEDRHIPRPA